MLCDDVFLRKPAERVRLAAERLKLLWQVDISGCPVRQTAGTGGSVEDFPVRNSFWIGWLRTDLLNSLS